MYKIIHFNLFSASISTFALLLAVVIYCKMNQLSKQVMMLMPTEEKQKIDNLMEDQPPPGPYDQFLEYVKEKWAASKKKSELQKPDVFVIPDPEKQ